MRRDAWLPILLAATAVAGIAAVRFGPAPVPTSDPDLAYYFRDTASALDDARDRWWVAVHALGAVAIVAAMALGGERPAGRLLAVARRAAVAFLVVLVLVAGTRTMPSDPWIQGLGWRFPAGVAIAAVLWRARARLDALASRPLVRRSVATIALGTVWLAALQTPWNVVDTNHMLYTSDEMLAPAAGRWPLVDYLPQYSNLLGIPLAIIAPLTGTSPVHVAVIASVVLVAVTLWVFLRILRDVQPTSIPRSTWALAAVASAWPAFSNGFLEGGERALGALNSGAMRPLLPLVLGLALGGATRSAGARARTVLGVGAVAGVTALNNVDFGAPALLAGAAAVVLASGSDPGDDARRAGVRAAGRSLALYLAGALTAGGAVLGTITLAAWGRPQPLLGALTALTYSRFGWFNVAMPVYGLHSLAAVLFLATAGLGVSALARSTSGRTGLATAARATGMATRTAVTGAISTTTATRATYFGLLGIGVLPYYAGRSLTPVLVIGYAFVIGICAAHVIALTTSRLVWLALVGAGLAAWSFVPQPLQSLARLTEPGAEETHDMVRVVDLDRRAGALRASADALSPGLDVGLVASSGNSLALATGITNAVFTSNAAFVLSGDYWTALQCDHLATTGLDVVLVEDPVVAEALVDNAECAEALDQSSARLLDTGWTAIDLRPGGG